MPSSLIKRTAVDEIIKFLHTDDIIVVHGARQVGKTSILMYLKSHLESAGERTHYIDLEDSRFVRVLNQGVDEFIVHLKELGFDLAAFQAQGKKLFVMVDEIQYLENPSPFLKLLADHHRYLKIIVSGSSSFEMKSKFKDSLVGRTVNFEIYPLSFREFLEFRGVPFAPAERFTEKKTAELQALYGEFVLYGGYPKIVLTPEADIKEKYLQQIIDTYIRKDIRDLAEIRDVNKFNALVEALASQSGNLLNVKEISNTCNLTIETTQRYLFLLEQTYILKLVRPFSRNARAELTKTPKIFFYDTGLMQMLWLKRLPREILGAAFETSLFGEFVKCYGSDVVHYWRTAEKQEVDFIVKLPQELRAYEAKTQFPRAVPTALLSFSKSYQTPFAKVVGLYGSPANDSMIFPWQI